MEARIIKVIGKVQGVFFRNSTKEAADRLGVKGWVQNEPDGSVLIEAEANPEIMEQFLKWCSHGPERARVDEVQTNNKSFTGFPSFEVRR